MDRLAFTAMASINERRLLREQLNNELANASTVGFKKSFDNAMVAVKAKGDGWDTRIQPFIEKMNAVSLEPGHLMATGNKMDIALQEQAVMGIQAKDGTLAFTRRGDLRVNAQGTLETGSGQVVRGDGGPIVVPPGFNVSINTDGTVYAADPNQPTAQPALIGQILLRDASERPMVRRNDGLFAPQGLPPGADFASGPQQPTLTPNALEGSNVNAIYAMTRMIDHSRSFEAQVNAIKQAKSLDESGSTMLKAS